ncbi:MAG: hypothetical protein AAF938_28795, partial [Myxococcota bacterium]
RNTNGTTCGSTTTSDGACGGFTSTCDNTGSFTRTTTTRTCGSGSCQSNDSTQSIGCSRNTTGTVCGSESCGPYGTCIGGSGCMGIEQRTCSTPLCAAGSCSDSSDRTENQSCIKPNGTDCSASCGGRRCGGECSGGTCNPT